MIHVGDWFLPLKKWVGGGWVLWTQSKFFLDVWNFFNFAKPPSMLRGIMSYIIIRRRIE